MTGGDENFTDWVQQKMPRRYLFREDKRGRKGARG